MEPHSGGERNFYGPAFLFFSGETSGLRRKLRWIAVDPEACPQLARQPRAYGSSDVAGNTRLLRMRTPLHPLIPPALQAGGLRQHGSALPDFDSYFSELYYRPASAAAGKCPADRFGDDE